MRTPFLLSQTLRRVIATATLLGSPSLLAAEHLLTPLRPTALRAEQLKQLLKKEAANPELRALFSASESQALFRLGDQRLAESLKATGKTPAQDAAIQQIARRAGWSADPNGRAELQNTSSLAQLQWGLDNPKGEAQKLTLSETRALMIPGVAGEDSGALRARPPRAGRAEVTVAVLDTGVDGKHPDLDGQLATPDQDAPSALSDEIGHGTHVAGIIAANGRVKGIAPMARVLPVKVIRRAPNSPIRPQDTVELKDGAFADDIARGLLAALRQKAQIIHLSLAWPKAADAEVLRRLVALARSQDVLVVSAAGNDSAQAQVYPCSYDGVVCVAAHGPDGALSHFSNYGSSTDVAAPGLAILSTWPVARQPSTFTAFLGYELRNGTSMAAPFVSGMLARLLSEGYSPAEARARVLLGTRPVREPTWENEALLARLRKWVTRGNADLARALELAPQALFERESKAPLTLHWSPRNPRQSGKLAIRVPLINSWANADAAVSASLRLLPWEGAAVPAREARLTHRSLRLAPWKSGESRTIETSLEVLDPARLESRYVLEVKLAQVGKALPSQRLRIPLEITQLMNGTPGSGQHAELVGSALSLQTLTDLRSVSARDGRAVHEFFAISENPASADDVQWTLQRLTRESNGNSLKIRVSAPFAASMGVAKQGLSLYQIDRLRAADGSSRYAFVTLLGKASPASPPRVRITVIGEQGEAVQVIEHDNTVSALPENFRWMAMEESSELRPAWIGAGTTPSLEKKPYDPWDPNPKDMPERRFYYLARDGVRSLAAPKTDQGKAQDWVALLQPTDEDLRNGRVRALLVSGEDYAVRYTVATIRNAQIEGIQPIEVDPYRMLDGLPQIGRVQALAAGHVGTAFSGAGTLASLRTTLLLPGGSADLRHDPVSALDSVMSALGVFSGPTQRASFVETHTALQYHDHLSGEVALTSLGRYSFLPTFIFSQSYFPIIAAGNTPALLIPSELGTVDGVGVVRPVRDASGALQLSRPALNQWETGDSCVRIGNPIQSEAGTQMAWLCTQGWWEVAF